MNTSHVNTFFWHPQYINKLHRGVPNIHVILFTTNLSNSGPQILSLNAILNHKTKLMK